MTESMENGVAPEAPDKQRLEVDMDMLVGYILLIGVLLSLLLILIALTWKWKLTGNVEFEYKLSGLNFFQLAMHEFRLVAAGSVSPRLMLSLGILVLMLTPFIRVLVSMVYFIVALKNWKYTLFTAFVMVMLTYSLFLR
jgi:uncharacterized membrane protein